MPVPVFVPMPLFRAVAASLAAGFLCLGPAHAQDERAQAVCAEAEERYDEIFGRPSADEPFTVVLMYQSAFCPVDVTVKRGDQVRWVNVEKRTSHSIWFEDAGLPESERVFPEENIDMTVDLPAGEHRYLCGPHWERQNMIGRLTVVE